MEPTKQTETSLQDEIRDVIEETSSWEHSFSVSSSKRPFETDHQEDFMHVKGGEQNNTATGERHINFFFLSCQSEVLAT